MYKYNCIIYIKQYIKILPFKAATVETRRIKTVTVETCHITAITLVSPTNSINLQI